MHMCMGAGAARWSTRAVGVRGSMVRMNIDSSMAAVTAPSVRCV